MTAKKPLGKTPVGSFERSLKRLEEIIEALEGGNITLDETMQMYEEGIELSRTCLEQLGKAELKLKTLGKNLNGQFELLDGSEE